MTKKGSIPIYSVVRDALFAAARRAGQLGASATQGRHLQHWFDRQPVRGRQAQAQNSGCRGGAGL